MEENSDSYVCSCGPPLWLKGLLRVAECYSKRLTDCPYPTLHSSKGEKTSVEDRAGRRVPNVARESSRPEAIAMR